MDESQNPQRGNASNQVNDTSEPNQPVLDALTAPKRAQTDELGSEPASKKPNVVSDPEEPDELDLDALMAQLQQHTERASMEPPTIESTDTQGLETANSEKVSACNTESGDQQPQQTFHMDAELSIEQQLKGALSSLEFDDDIGLDQLSQMLKPKDKELNDEKNNDKEPETRQNEEKAVDEPESSIEKPEDSSSVPRKEALASQMPPPPVVHGHLPPMPPPPAAFTSPVAPFALPPPTETDTDAVSTKRPIAKAPQFSEPPAPLSENYEKSLMEQIEQVEEDEAGREGQLPLPQFLNDIKAVTQARTRSILLLDSLACQVLETLSSSHYQETLSTVMQPESERGILYRILLDAFEDLKRIYFKWETQSSRLSSQPKPQGVRPFIPHDLPGVDPTRDNLITIQRVNMATFMAALFGSIEIGFWELDEWFVRVFVTEGGRLLKQQANIYLDLKTQAYISAVESTDDKDVHKQALEHLFPADLEAKLKFLLEVRVHLAPTERDFVAKCHRRKDNILSEKPEDLPTKYHWVPFLREVSDYVSRNHLTLLPPRKQTMLVGEPDGLSNMSSISQTPSVPRNYPVPRRQAPAPSSRASSVVAEDKKEEVEVTAVKKTPKIEITDSADKLDEESKDKSSDGNTNDIHEDKSSDTAGQSSSSSGIPSIPSEGHPLFPPLPRQVLPPPSLSGANTPVPVPVPVPVVTETERIRRPGPKANQELAPPGKPLDTLAAYEAAKASAEGTDAVRPKSTVFTTRRTWTKQEEEALLKGMDRVQGPYWAQILELYGPGGKISEVLKDRSQVQLKDKARNLKMFFVRLGLPIPAVFQYVTGDYETRRSSGRRLRDRRQQSAQTPQPTQPGQVMAQAPQALPQAPTQAQDQISKAPVQGPSQVPSQAPVQAPPRAVGTQPSETQNESVPESTQSPSKENQVTTEPNSTDQEPQTNASVVVSASDTTSVVSSNLDTHSKPNEQQIAEENSKEQDTQEEKAGPSAEAEKPEEKFDNIFEDPNEKDDLNTLLHRVGEYVDNH